MRPAGSQTTLADAVARAEFASRLAKRLLLFQLIPMLGSTMAEHTQCLETAYAMEITKALNEAMP